MGILWQSMVIWLKGCYMVERLFHALANSFAWPSQLFNSSNFAHLLAHLLNQIRKSVELPPRPPRIVSLCAATPFFLFTRVNYIDRPLGSGHFLQDSAFCALLSENIYPRVRKGKLLLKF